MREAASHGLPPLISLGVSAHTKTLFAYRFSLFILHPCFFDRYSFTDLRGDCIRLGKSSVNSGDDTTTKHSVVQNDPRLLSPLIQPDNFIGFRRVCNGVKQALVLDAPTQMVALCGIQMDRRCHRRIAATGFDALTICRRQVICQNLHLPGIGPGNKPVSI